MPSYVFSDAFATQTNLPQQNTNYALAPLHVFFLDTPPHIVAIVVLIFQVGV